MKPLFLTLLCTLYFFVLPAVAEVPEVALPKELTLDQAVAIFRKNGYDLLIADANIRQAEGDLRSARGIQNPILVGLGIGKTFGYDASQCSGCSDIQYNASISDSATIVDLFAAKRIFRSKAADLALKATRLGKQDAERQLVSLLKQQFVRTKLAQMNVDLTQQFYDSIVKTFDLITKRFKAGAISEADVARMDVARLAAAQAVDVAIQNHGANQANLVYLLGARHFTGKLILLGTLDHPVAPSSLKDTSKDALLEIALQNRPDLRAARFLRIRAKHSLTSARLEWFPDLIWSLNYVSEGTGQQAITPPTLSMGLSIPLPTIGKTSGDVIKAKAGLYIQDLTLAKATAQVVSDIDTGWIIYERAQLRIERMETSLLKQASRAKDLVTLQYQKGAASLLDFLDAERTYISTNSDHIQTLSDYWTAVFQLEQAIGKELS